MNDNIIVKITIPFSEYQNWSDYEKGMGTLKSELKSNISYDLRKSGITSATIEVKIEKP